MKPQQQISKPDYIRIFFLLIFISCIFCPGLKAQSINLEEFRDEEGWLDFEGGLEIEVDSVFLKFATPLGLGEDDQMMQIVPDDKEELGENVVVFQQYHKGYEVEDAKYILIVEDDKVLKMKGTIVSSLDIDVDNYIEETAALEFALSSINEEKYAWESEEYEHGLVLATGNEDASYYPQGKLFIGKANGKEPERESYAFTWKFNIVSTDPLLSHTVYVDQLENVIFACVQGEYSAPPINLQDFELQTDLSDEFNGSLDPSVWKYDPVYFACRPGDQDLSLPQTSNFIYPTINDPTTGTPIGILRLQIKKESSPLYYPCSSGATYFDYSSGKIDSKEIYLYGYFEIRCKYPSNTPPLQVQQNFWLWGMYDDYNWSKDNVPFDNYSEIDVFEHTPTNGNGEHYSTNFHAGTTDVWCLNGNAYDPEICLRLEDEYHRYGIFWTPEKTTFYFDGRPLQNPNGPNGVHEVEECCLDATPQSSVSDLEAMWVIIDQAIRPAAANNPNFPYNLPESGDPVSLDIDYFRYYKKRPDITGPDILCAAETTLYSASMYGGNETSDEYTWSISGSGTIISSTTGNSVTVVSTTANSSFTLTLTANETTPGYEYDDHITTPGIYYYATERNSTTHKTVQTRSVDPVLVLSQQTGVHCTKEINAWEFGEQEYWFRSKTTGSWSSWELGERNVYTYNGIDDYYWSYGAFTYNAQTNHVECKAFGECGWSDVTSKSFTLSIPPQTHGCQYRLSRSEESEHKSNQEEQFIHVFPNPASHNIRIDYFLKESGIASLNLYNAYGQKVHSVFNDKLQSYGDHSIDVDGLMLDNGIYFCSLKLADDTFIERMIVLQ